MTHRTRVVAVIPVGTLEGAKSRLGAVLDAEERRDLVTRLAVETIRAVVGVGAPLAETIVVTPDDEVRSLALDAGARPLRQRGHGLNAGVRQARDEAIDGGASAVLILPIDLPRITPEAVAAVLATLDDHRQPLVAIVADRHGRGTNALLLSPPDVIDPQFGGDSHEAHVAAARAAGATVVELDGPLADDLDTPEDLLVAQAEGRVHTHG
jgi:2-phospho-L-lactate guanylyltransferase